MCIASQHVQVCGSFSARFGPRKDLQERTSSRTKEGTAYGVHKRLTMLLRRATKW